MTTTEQTYSGSARGVLIGSERVAQELRAHGFSDAETLEECLAESQVRPGVFDAGRVLAFLGY
jgi:hypothetical protein